MDEYQYRLSTGGMDASGNLITPKPYTKPYTMSKSLVTGDLKNSYLYLKEKLSIEKFVVDADYNLTSPDTILTSLKNKNCVLLIIEKMSLGIIMIDHIAFKFKYIEHLLKWGQCEYFEDYAIKIVRITDQWDTSGWNYSKILRLYSNLGVVYYEQSNIEKIKNDSKNERDLWKAEKIDIPFFEALSWDGSSADF